MFERLKTDFFWKKDKVQEDHFRCLKYLDTYDKRLKKNKIDPVSFFFILINKVLTFIDSIRKMKICRKIIIFSDIRIILSCVQLYIVMVIKTQTLKKKHIKGILMLLRFLT